MCEKHGSTGRSIAMASRPPAGRTASMRIA